MKLFPALTMACILLGCTTLQRTARQSDIATQAVSGFEYFQPEYLNITVLRPIGSETNEYRGGGITFHGVDFQFSIAPITRKTEMGSLDSILDGICSISSVNPYGTVTKRYEITNEVGQWIRFDTDCPMNEGMQDIMIARIGTGTYLLTLLDGTTDKMAVKIEEAFLQIRKIETSTIE